MSSPGLSSVGVPASVSCKDTGHAGFGPRLVASSNLHYLSKARSADTVTVRVRASTQVWGSGGHGLIQSKGDEGSAVPPVPGSRCPPDALPRPGSSRRVGTLVDVCSWSFSLSLFFNEVSKSVSTAEQQLWKKSFSCFEKGIHNFESIDDATNAALLLCNTGRLMRICAQAHCGAGDEFKREFSPEEGLYYNKVTLAPASDPIRSRLAVVPLKHYKIKVMMVKTRQMIKTLRNWPGVLRTWY